MKPYNGYEARKKSVKENLPAGGYVVKVLDAAERRYDWGNVIEISFDVAEGEYTGFFQKDYKNNMNEDKKWRGKFRLVEPKDDGSDKDAWTKKNFEGVIYAFEHSNPGFHWDWKEENLKGLTVGALFRNKEWEMDGNTGWTTECCDFVESDDIRQNKYRMPKDKPLKNHAGTHKTDNKGFEEIIDDDGLPFSL